MASRDYTDGFISNAASTSKSNGYLPKFEGGSANALTDHLTGRFEDYSLGVKNHLKLDSKVPQIDRIRKTSIFTFFHIVGVFLRLQKFNDFL